MKKPEKKQKGKRRSNKRGMPPGSLIHIGDRKVDTARMQLYSYNADLLDILDPLDSVKIIKERRNDACVQWLNVHGLHDTELIQQIGIDFEIDKLILEDLLDTTHRPKLEEYPNCLFFTLKSLVNVTSGNYDLEQISFVLGKDYVISLQEKPADIFGHIRERIKSNKGIIRQKPADYLLYVLLDGVIDQYYTVLDSVEDTIEALEDEVVENPSADTLFRTERLKKQLVGLRKAIMPLKEAVNLLDKGNLQWINQEQHKYFSDLKDGTLDVIESVEAYRQMLESIENLYMSSLGQRTNDVMKVLTVMSVIFIPLTFIAGIYGMNFKYMPELELEDGYFYIWGVMIIVTLIMLYYFKRKKWL